MIARILLGVVSVAACSMSIAQQSAPLAIEAKIPLGLVKGRIDHLAIDIAHQRLFVAELGNDSVGVVDLATRAVARTVTGLDEPQGIAYMPATDVLYVANGGDGSLRSFQGADLTPGQAIELGEDADNVRIDDDRQQIYVGYGSGVLAVIDAKTGKRIADITLKAHPESFQLDASASRIYVNLPDAHEIGVIDRKTKQQVASWSTEELHANFPLAIDETGQRLLTVFRRPAILAALKLSDGTRLAALSTCGDADDVFGDAKRGLVYLSCGEGYVDILRSGDVKYSRVARVKTVVGARTALFVPALDRLYLAVRATTEEPAAIWILRATD
jgi:YVTN family beta-propeller protein